MGLYEGHWTYLTKSFDSEIWWKYGNEFPDTNPLKNASFWILEGYSLVTNSKYGQMVWRNSRMSEESLHCCVLCIPDMDLVTERLVSLSFCIWVALEWLTLALLSKDHLKAFYILCLTSCISPCRSFSLFLSFSGTVISAVVPIDELRDGECTRLSVDNITSVGPRIGNCTVSWNSSNLIQIRFSIPTILLKDKGGQSKWNMHSMPQQEGVQFRF